MICDVFYKAETTDTLILCDGDRVLNGSQTIQRLENGRACIPGHAGIWFCVGQIDHQGDYVETLDRFRRNRKEALDPYCRTITLPDEWLRPTAEGALRFYDRRSRYPAGLVNSMYGKKERKMDERSGFVVNQPVDGVVTICDEHQVDAYCRRGYRLLQIIYSDYSEMLHETTHDSENGYNNSYGQKTHTVSKPMVLRRARFVMVLGEDQALAEADEKISELEAELLRVNQAASDISKTKEADEKRVKELEGVRDRHLETIRSKTGELDTLRDKNRKLEGDIGKIRTAVGDLKMKEILGG